MARFSLWVAALSLVCLLPVMSSATTTTTHAPPVNPDANTCTQYFDNGSTMSIARVFDMILAHYISYVPDFGTELVKEFMKHADANQDNHLDLNECLYLIQYIKQRTPTK